MRDSWLCLCSRDYQCLAVKGLTFPRLCFHKGMGQYKFTQPFGRQFVSMYQERHKTSKIFDPVIPFLGIYPKEIILNRDEGFCTKIFNIISFIIGKNGIYREKLKKNYSTTIQCNTTQHNKEVNLYVPMWKNGYNK